VTRWAGRVALIRAAEWRDGAGFLRAYLPERGGLDLASLVRAVAGLATPLEGAEAWPDLPLPARKPGFAPGR